MEYYILIYLPVSEWVTLRVILLSFLLPRKSLNLHFPQIRTHWAQISYITLEILQSEFTFSFFLFFFFSSIETGNLALGVPLSHCWQRSTAGWHLSSATAELKFSLPNSKTCFKQTNKTRKNPSKNSTIAVWSRSEFEKIWFIFSASPPSEKFPSSTTWAELCSD